MGALTPRGETAARYGNGGSRVCVSGHPATNFMLERELLMENEFTFQETLKEAKSLLVQAKKLEEQASKEWHEALFAHLKVGDLGSVESLDKSKEYLLCSGQAKKGGWIKFSYVYIPYSQMWSICFSSLEQGEERKNQELLDLAVQIWFATPSWSNGENE